MYMCIYIHVFIWIYDYVYISILYYICAYSQKAMKLCENIRGWVKACQNLS